MVTGPPAFAEPWKVGHPLRTMPTIAALALAAAVSANPAARAPAPAPRPADAAGVLAEVRKPGASAVILNVWATWCAPCREEFPALLRVAKELSGRGLRLVLVSADFPGMEREVATFLTEQGVDFPTLMKTGKDDAFVNDLDARWTGALPATFVYDAHGKIVRYWEGKASYTLIKKRALEALGVKEDP